MSSKAIRVPQNEGERLLGRAVNVVVGPQNDIFSVHEKLIRASSPFFDKAMSGPWQESSQHIVKLPEDEPDIFGNYVHWLYYGTLPVFSDEPGLPGNVEYLNLVKAYTLGDKLLDTKFQDAAIDAMVEKAASKAIDGDSWHPVGEVIEYVYSNTKKSALVRKLLVDMYVASGHSHWLLNYGDPANVPQEFLLELASKLLDQYDRPRSKIEAYSYHIHASNDGEVKSQNGNS